MAPACPAVASNFVADSRIWRSLLPSSFTNRGAARASPFGFWAEIAVSISKPLRHSCGRRGSSSFISCAVTAVGERRPKSTSSSVSGFCTPGVGSSSRLTSFAKCGSIVRGFCLVIVPRSSSESRRFSIRESWICPTRGPITASKSSGCCLNRWVSSSTTWCRTAGLSSVSS